MRRTATLLSPTLLLFLGCAKPTEAPPVGTIDGEPIARADFVQALLEAHGDTFFREYVERRLLEREAEKAGVTVDRKILAEAVDRQTNEMLLRRFAGQRAAFEEQLAQRGITFEAWRAARLRDERTLRLAQGLMRAQVDEAEIKQLFDLRFGVDGYDRKVSHLLISTRVPASRFYTRAQYDAERAEVQAAAKAQAEALRGQLLKGADFDALAREHSDDYSTQRQGSLDVRWAGRFGQAFGRRHRGLGGRRHQPVIESSKGFHVARVDGIRKGAKYEGAWIFVPASTGENDAARFAAAEKKAEALAEQLEGGADFAELARAESGDQATRVQGGSLGSFAPGRLGPAADPVLEVLPIGKVSRPIRLAEGYGLLRLDGRKWLPEQDRKRVRHILISTEYPAVKARKLEGTLERRARDKAEALLKRALAPDADFAALAKEHSEDEVSRRAGGRLGRYRPGLLGPAIDAALPQMKPGEVRLLRGSRGFHLLRLDGVARTELAEVRADLERELRKRSIKPDAVRAYLAGLREAAEVERAAKAW